MKESINISKSFEATSQRKYIDKLFVTHLRRPNSKNTSNSCKNKIFKSLCKVNKKIIIFLILLSFISFLCIVFWNLFENDSPKFSSDYLNLFIVAHKDFHNKITNPYYKIICDNKSQLKNKYPLKIIETYKNNELFPKRIGYSEGSKIYYIWKKYKAKEISTKYIGFVHYRRVFSFKNKIPNLDKIFNKYGAIINKPFSFKKSVKTQFCEYHICQYLDEIEEIIKENFTEYYSSAKKSLNDKRFNCCNVFIMKNKDFIKYGEFIFGVLFEFDRRHKIKNDDDIINLIEIEKKKTGTKFESNYQCRQEAFLMERLSIIFYNYYFKKTLKYRLSGQ
jgi:hypothetical protein